MRRIRWQTIIKSARLGGASSGSDTGWPCHCASLPTSLIRWEYVATEQKGVRLLTHQPQRYEGTALLHDARSKQTWRHQRPEARPGGDGVVVDMSVWLKRFEERKGKRQG